MKILTSLSKKLSTALDIAVEKNKQCAQNNRVKSLIKQESTKINNYYIEIGKYCYKNDLDSVPDEIKQLYKDIDNSRRIIKKAKNKLNPKKDIQNKNIDTSYNKINDTDDQIIEKLLINRPEQNISNEPEATKEKTTEKNKDENLQKASTSTKKKSKKKASKDIEAAEESEENLPFSIDEENDK